MTLTFELTNPATQSPAPVERKTFDGTGGTIGRSPDNDLVLSDGLVSGRHAIVTYVNGAFFIEDTSRNGIFLKTRDGKQPIGKPRYEVKSGDCICIDPYEMQATVSA